MTNTVRDHLRALAFLEGLTDTAVHQLSQHRQARRVRMRRDAVRRGRAAASPRARGVRGRCDREAPEWPPDPPRHPRRGRGGGRGAPARRFQRTAPAPAPSCATTAYVLTREQIDGMLKESPTLYAALVGRAARAISQRLSRGRRHARRPRPHRSASAARARAPSTTCSATARCRTTRSTACRRCARWRTSRSPASPLREFPALIEALAAVKEAAALANARARAARRPRSPTLIVRACAARSAPAAITSTSSST